MADYLVRTLFWQALRRHHQKLVIQQNTLRRSAVQLLSGLQKHLLNTLLIVHSLVVVALDSDWPPLNSLLPLPASIMASKDGCTRLWSCSTLADGVDTLLEQSKAQDAQELHLQELIKDFDFKSSMVQLCHPVFPRVT